MPTGSTVHIHNAETEWAPPAHETTMADLFERQVAKTPNAVALACKGRQMTYSDLDARANQFAWSLRGGESGRKTL